MKYKNSAISGNICTFNAQEKWEALLGLSRANRQSSIDPLEQLPISAAYWARRRRVLLHRIPAEPHFLS